MNYSFIFYLLICLGTPPLFAMEQEMPDSESTSEISDAEMVGTLLAFADIDIDSGKKIVNLNEIDQEETLINKEFETLITANNELENYKILKLEKHKDNIFGLLIDPQGINALFTFDATTGHYKETLDANLVQFGLDKETGSFIFTCKKTHWPENDKISSFTIYAQPIANSDIQTRIMICPFNFFIDRKITHLQLCKENKLYFYNKFLANLPEQFTVNKEGIFKINLEHFFQLHDDLQKLDVKQKRFLKNILAKRSEWHIKKKSLLTYQAMCPEKKNYIDNLNQELSADTYKSLPALIKSALTTRFHVQPQ